tara:strand:+ start:9202 stop:10035 length:834 start_codon:yes stop_codon:yes gene_type:complete
MHSRRGQETGGAGLRFFRIFNAISNYPAAPWLPEGNIILRFLLEITFTGEIVDRTSLVEAGFDAPPPGNEKMKLYYTPGVCSQAVHIALRELGADYTLEKVDLATKKTESGNDFTRVNPLGYVPALELDNGEVLLEAPAILQYLADLKPESMLAPAAGTLERVRLQQQLNFTASELHKSFGPFFAAVKPEGEALEQAMTKLRRRFDALDALLSDGRSYAMGENFTVADTYMFVVASWSKIIGLDLSSWPHVQKFVARVAARPRVQEVLRREGLLDAA